MAPILMMKKIDSATAIRNPKRLSWPHPAGPSDCRAISLSRATRSPVWLGSGLNLLGVGFREWVLERPGPRALHPPAIRRRGVPEDIQERVDANDVPVGVHEVSSSLTGLYRLSGGGTALFHHDAMLEGEPGRGTITADIYLTVIAPDRKTACVDGLVPHFKAMRAIHTVVRDTAFLLDRRLDEAEERLERQLPVQCAESNKPRASPSQGGSLPHTSREEVMNRSEVS